MCEETNAFLTNYNIVNTEEKQHALQERRLYNVLYGYSLNTALKPGFHYPS